jgi:hypothetical protein
VPPDNYLGLHNNTVAEASSTTQAVMPAEIGLLGIEQVTLLHIPAHSNVSHVWPPELVTLPGLVKIVEKESSGLTRVVRYSMLLHAVLALAHSRFERSAHFVLPIRRFLLKWDFPPH